MPDEPVRPVEPDEMPLWRPSEALTRAMFELCRDHWPAVRQYALAHGTRGVAVVDRVNAEKLGGWPPPVVVVHRGAEYGVGSCRPTSRQPTLQAELDRDPGSIRVLVSTWVATGATGLGEFVFNSDAGPSGHELAQGGPPP